MGALTRERLKLLWINHWRYSIKAVEDGHHFCMDWFPTKSCFRCAFLVCHRAGCLLEWRSTLHCLTWQPPPPQANDEQMNSWSNCIKRSQKKKKKRRARAIATEVLTQWRAMVLCWSLLPTSYAPSPLGHDTFIGGIISSRLVSNKTCLIINTGWRFTAFSEIRDSRSNWDSYFSFFALDSSSGSQHL